MRFGVAFSPGREQKSDRGVLDRRPSHLGNRSIAFPFS